MENLFYNQHNIAQLIANLMERGEISSPDELDKWLEKNRNSESVQLFSNPEKLKIEVDNFYRKEKFNSCRKLIAKIERRNHRKIIIKISSIAAAIIAVSFLLWQTVAPTITDNKIEKKVVAIENQYNEVSNKPIIVLENGEQIDINDNDKKAIAGAIISKEAENTISYAKTTEIFQTIQYNTLIVPKSTKCTITLSDGTKIHLNTSSKLRYPTSFGEGDRVVYLEGEGFFEVTKSTKKFVVKVDDIDINVYGTKFNVEGYDKKNISTVLVNGKVGISSQTHKNKEEIILKPNQMSIINKEKFEGTITNVDANEYIAWTTGYFMFKNRTIYEIASELSRWHDVDFYFENEESYKELIFASFSHETSLDEILGMIEKISTLKFIKEGRSIMVK